MAGQQNFLNLSQENYFDKFEKDLLKQADLYYLNIKFGVGEDVDFNKVRHAQMFYNILCTNECELIDWVWKKININSNNEECEIQSSINPIYFTAFGQNDCRSITEVCKWEQIEW